MHRALTDHGNGPTYPIGCDDTGFTNVGPGSWPLMAPTSFLFHFPPFSFYGCPAKHCWNVGPKFTVGGCSGWLEFNVPFQHTYGYITDEGRLF